MTAYPSFSSASSLLFLINFEPDLLQRFKDKLSQTDVESLENYLSDERKLGILKNKLFDKLTKAQLQFEREWEMNAEEKCQLIGEIENCLYELQLVEHALKVPMLGIAKILFSINPIRFADKSASQIKQRPAKKRKNELGGLVGDQNDDLNKIPAREAKLLAVSQVHRHHQEERIEEMIGLGSDGLKKNKQKRRTVPTANRSVNDGIDNEKAKTAVQHAQEGNNLMDAEDELQPNFEEEEKEHGRGADAQMLNDNPLNIAQIPAIFSADGCQQGCTNSPQRAESSGNCSSELMHSPPRTRATKKKSQETPDIACGISESMRLTNAKSPRKRRASTTEEHQQQNGANNEIYQMEVGESEDKGRMGKQPKQQPDEAEPTYCLCEQVSFGEMICCDYELCSVEWFHFACVNIKSKPKGKKWFCPLCRYNDKANMLKPEFLQKLDLTRDRSQ